MATVSLAGVRTVERYLLPTERVVVAVRRHWTQVLEPVATTGAGLVVAYLVDAALPAGTPVVRDVLWWGWLLLALRLAWYVVQWRNDWFVATDKRLILTYGLVTRKVAMMPMRKVTDLSYVRSPAGRLLGYGEFVLESAGQDQALSTVDHLPDPDALYRDICEELFGRGAGGLVRREVPSAED